MQSAKDLAVFWQDLIALYRDMLVLKTTKSYMTYLDLTDEEGRQLQELAARFSKETLLFHQRLLDAALITMQSANALKQVTAEMTLMRMCDETLSTSNEALLSRIARLEEMMMSGGWHAASTPAATSSGEQPTPSAPPRQQAAPIEAPTASTAAVPIPEAKATSQKQVAATAGQESGKRVLRPLRVWPEVIERMSDRSPMYGSFLRQIHAYETEEGTVLLRFDNEFAKTMLDQNDTKDLMRGALSVCLRREVRESDMVCQVMPPEAGGCAIDEIIEALDEE